MLMKISVTTPNGKIRTMEVTTINQAKSIVFGIDKADMIQISYCDKDFDHVSICCFPNLRNFRNWERGMLSNREKSEKLLTRFKKASYAK